MTSVPLSRFPPSMQSFAMPYPSADAQHSTPNPWTTMYRVFTATFGLSFIFAFFDQSAGAGIAFIITAVCGGIGLIVTKVGAVLIEMRKLDQIKATVARQGRAIEELKEKTS